MPSWLEILLLAVASAFWPTLIAIVVVALRVEHTVKILAWFLVGGLLTTISVGIVVVFAMQGSSFVSGSSPPADPTFDITAGVLSLLAAYAVGHTHRRGRSEKAVESDTPPAQKRPSMAQRTVDRGPVVAFLAGVILNIIPGTFPIVGLKDIAELDVSNATKVAAIVIFYVIMFAFVEVPLVSYSVAPRRTTAAVNDFNVWLGRNARRVAIYVLVFVGLYLIVRGIVALVS